MASQRHPFLEHVHSPPSWCIEVSALLVMFPVPQALKEWYEKEGPKMTKLLEKRVGQKGDPIPSALPIVCQVYCQLLSTSFPVTVSSSLSLVT